MAYIAAGGRRIFYVRRAKSRPGPAVLFLHGAGGNALLWGHVLQHMPGVPAVAVDLPGHGRSAGTGLTTIDGYAEVVRACLRALELRGVILAGHSMGGAIALEVALREPTLLRGLVLMSVTARPFVAPALLVQLVEDPPAARQWIVDTGYGPEAPAQARALGARQLSQVPPEVLHGDFLACSAYDARPRLAEIALPALVLCGSEDRLTPARYVRALHEGLPNARLELVPGAGHMLPLECPEAVAAMTSRFLASLTDAWPGGCQAADGA